MLYVGKDYHFLHFTFSHFGTEKWLTNNKNKDITKFLSNMPLQRDVAMCSDQRDIVDDIEWDF
jgi:hypothetical protein